MELVKTTLARREGFVPNPKLHLREVVRFKQFSARKEAGEKGQVVRAAGNEPADEQQRDEKAPEPFHAADSTKTGRNFNREVFAPRHRLSFSLDLHRSF